MFAIPVMLLVYLVGAHMWTLTWNAQYAHVKARYDVHQQAKHRPCSTGNEAINGDLTGEANVQTGEASFYGGRFKAFSGRNMKAKYVIICG